MTSGKRSFWRLAPLLALLCACHGQGGFAERLLSNLLDINLAEHQVTSVSGDGCRIDHVTLSHTALSDAALTATGFVRAPSLAFATERAADLGFTATNSIALAQTLGAARNCFDDRDTFQTLANLTPVWVYFQRGGYTFVIIPDRDRATLYLVRG